MRLTAAASAALLVGCTFGKSLPNGEPPEEAGAPITDGKSIDARLLDGCTTFSTALDTCAIGVYGAGLSVNGNRQYDTATHVLSDDNGGNPTTPMFREVTIGGNPITLLVLDGFTIQSMARLRVIGARAFGVVATGTISIVGTLDATAGGAGARSLMTCDAVDSEGAPGGNNNTAADGGASGGGGGGFRGAGGKGGTGDNEGPQVAGGDGGDALAIATTFIGGCPGGKGGNDQSGGGEGGPGGIGGGGIVLISAMQLSIPGILTAGGGGGKAATAVDGGGGGGGSGGMIALEAASLMINGFVVANGGSGGAGAGAAAGQDGITGTITAVGTPGGLASGSGGSGGAGGATAQNAGQQPGNAEGGGGGGGGGVGYVTLKSGTAPVITGIVSPSATTWPF